MLSVRRVSIGLAVAGGLVWAAWSFGSPQSSPAAESKDHAAQSDATQSDATQSATDVESAEGSLLAARYHLRNRTSRFFQRASGSSRGGAAKSRTYRRGSRRRFSAATVEDFDLLAGRYHLRGRTGRFFRRATA